MLLAAVFSPAALGRTHPHPPVRPDLVVSQGSVALAHGKLSGSFVVADRGSAAAGRSTASLTLRAPHGVKTLAHFTVGMLKRSAATRIRLSIAPPAKLAAGVYPLGACADSAGVVHESSESDNCRRVGALTVASSQPSPVSTVPSAPLAFQPDTPLPLQSARSTYWVDVPGNYDASNRTPTELLVWLHGCGGEGAGDIYTVSPPGNRPYVSIAVGGREDACWDPNNDASIVQAAIDSVETHVNIDRHQVVLGGYSSGGDLAYRMAFDHSLEFAGVLAENTSPFRDTGSTAAQSLAAAQWKFHVVHLAHTEDGTYPIAGVQTEISQLKAAGFPVLFLTRPGTHYDDPAPGVPGTDADLQTYLLPHLSDGWRSP